MLSARGQEGTRLGAADRKEGGKESRGGHWASKRREPDREKKEQARIYEQVEEGYQPGADLGSGLGKVLWVPIYPS